MGTWPPLRPPGLGSRVWFSAIAISSKSTSPMPTKLKGFNHRHSPDRHPIADDGSCLSSVVQCRHRTRMTSAELSISKKRSAPNHACSFIPTLRLREVRRRPTGWTEHTSFSGSQGRPPQSLHRTGLQLQVRHGNFANLSWFIHCLCLKDSAILVWYGIWRYCEPWLVRSSPMSVLLCLSWASPALLRRVQPEPRRYQIRELPCMWCRTVRLISKRKAAALCPRAFRFLYHCNAFAGYESLHIGKHL
ncbi:hypothetical protein LZ30DRAFT_383049 [Colletotrichum cereale]|nr:hypothetical protein LZ30DRAFT_383049 [Colletotrichum cereale]